MASPPWHRNARKLRARARRAVRRDSFTEEQAGALLLHHGSALTRVALRIFRKNCSARLAVWCAGQGDASARRETAERRSPSRRKTWSPLVCGPAQSVLTRAILLAERRATSVVLGREWNGRLLPGEETGSRRNLVVMATGRVPS